MVGAYTTAAVINNGLYRPDQPMSPLRFMPNHREHEAVPRLAELTEEQMLARDMYLGQVYEMAAKLREQNHG
jgi:hypothetical protein